MKENQKNYWCSIKSFAKKEIVLCISFVVAALSVIAVPPDPIYAKYIDIKTIALIFSFMTTITGLNDIGLFSHLGKKLVSRTSNLRALSFTLMALCFFSSMILTNDVVLLTFVPFTILLLTIAEAEKWSIYIIILETIAANLGGMVTPIGNPQNFFLYAEYQIDFFKFEKMMLPLVALSLVSIFFAVLFIKKEKFSFGISSKVNGLGTDEKNFSLGIKGLGYIFTFSVSILCVAKILPYKILLAIVCVCFLLIDKKIFLKTNYALLFTFVCFFVFVGNLQRIDTIQLAIKKLVAGREFFSAVALSQILSNVPTAVLLSAFSDDYPSILYGTNIGALGTPVASLASLISFRLYTGTKNANAKRYMALFLVTNMIFLAVFCVGGLVLLAIDF